MLMHTYHIFTVCANIEQDYIRTVYKRMYLLAQAMKATALTGLATGLQSTSFSLRFREENKFLICSCTMQSSHFALVRVKKRPI